MQYDCPHKKRGEARRENTATWGWRPRLEWCIHRPENARDCQQTPGARKRRGRAFPGDLPRECRPANTSVSDSGLQGCGTDIPGLGYSSSRKLIH